MGDVKRNPQTGQFLPGHASAYRGLPAPVRDLRRTFGECVTPDMVARWIQRLDNLTTDPDSRVALEALRMALDRALGKVVTEMSMSVTSTSEAVTVSLSPDQVAALWQSRTILHQPADPLALPPATDQILLDNSVTQP